MKGQTPYVVAASCSHCPKRFQKCSQKTGYLCCKYSLINVYLIRILYCNPARNIGTIDGNCIDIDVNMISPFTLREIKTYLSHICFTPLNCTAIQHCTHRTRLYSIEHNATPLYTTYGFLLANENTCYIIIAL